MGNGLPTGGVSLFRDDLSLGTTFQSAGYATAYIGKYMNRYAQELDPIVPPGWSKFVYETTVGSSGATRTVGQTEPYRDPVRMFRFGFRSRSVCRVRSPVTSPAR